MPTATAVPAPAGPAIKRSGVLKQGDRPTVSRSFQDSLRNAKLGPEQVFATRLIYQTLFHFDPYANNRFSGILAKTWQFSATADEMTITIDPSARWADGKPVTAQDVKFTLDTFTNRPEGWTAVGSAAAIGTALKQGKVDVVDNQTVKVKLPAPDLSFQATLAGADAEILPAHRTLQQSVQEPMGSGAYQVTDVQIDVKYTFKKNPGYWMKDSQGGALPYLDGIENILLADTNIAVAATTTGQVDLLNNIWSPIVNPNVDQLQRRLPNATLQRTFGGVQGWGPKNVRPYNDVRVRKALWMLTPRLDLCVISSSKYCVIDFIAATPASIGGNWSLPTAEVLSSPGFRYLNRKTGELETDMTRLIQGGPEVYQKDPKDIETAKQLLKEVGLSPFPKITLYTGERYEARTVVIQNALKEALGVAPAITIVDTATFFEAIKTGAPYEFVSGFVGGGFVDEPSLTLRAYTTGKNSYFDGYQVPNLDALFQQQNRELDAVKRKQLVRQFQLAFMDSPHVIPTLAGYGPTGLVREYVKNAPMPQVNASNTYSLDRIWLDR